MLTNALREVKNQNANTIKQTLSDNTDVTSYWQYTTGLIFSWNHMQQLIFKTKIPLAVKRYTLILGPAKKYKCAPLAACTKKEKKSSSSKLHHNIFDWHHKSTNEERRREVYSSECKKYRSVALTGKLGCSSAVGLVAEDTCSSWTRS